MEDEDGVQRLGSLDQGLDECRIANVALEGLNTLWGGAFGHLGVGEICEDEVVAVVVEALGQHGANHAAGTGDDDVLA